MESHGIQVTYSCIREGQWPRWLLSSAVWHFNRLLMHLSRRNSYWRKDFSYLFFNLIINESVVPNVGSTTVLIALVWVGEILHSLLYGDINCSTNAVWPGMCPQLAEYSVLITKFEIKCYKFLFTAYQEPPLLFWMGSVPVCTSFWDVLHTGLHRNGLSFLACVLLFKVHPGRNLEMAVVLLVVWNLWGGTETFCMEHCQARSDSL